MDFLKKKKIVLHWFVNELTTPEKNAFLADLQLVSPHHSWFGQLDLTRLLPRSLSLHIFSFLDPRSLSRCAQVCWFWNYLSEADEIWRAKCKRLGWKPTSAVRHRFRTWKQTYIDNVVNLRHLDANMAVAPHISQGVLHGSAFSNSETAEITPMNNVPVVTDDTWQQFVDNQNQENQEKSSKPPLAQERISRSRENGGAKNVSPTTSASNNVQLSTGQRSSSASRAKSAAATSIAQGKPNWQPSQPWRAANRKPTDIRRFNYLDNEDRIIAARAKRLEQVARHSLMLTNPASSEEESASQLRSIGTKYSSDHENITTKPKIQPQSEVPVDNKTLFASSLRSGTGNTLPPWLNRPKMLEASADHNSLNVKPSGRPRSHRDLPSVPLFPEEQDLSVDSGVPVNNNRY